MLAAKTTTKEVLKAIPLPLDAVLVQSMILGTIWELDAYRKQTEISATKQADMCDLCDLYGHATD